YTTSDKFYLEPTINPTEILVIDRVSGEASVKDIGSVKIPIPANAYRPVCGFLGSIKLISGLYLVVAKYRILVGKLNGHEIYQLAGTDIIPYARSNTHLTNKQIEDNATYERMLRAALDTVGIYFSYTYDLTHCLQRLHGVAASRLPAVVSINNVTVNGHALTWSLVSRRSVDRAGTRFFMRGVDAQGNVANFVETEQIVERGGEKSSFVQTRGSIPLFWSQYPDIKYKPAMQLSHEDHVAAYTKHLRDQQQRYGNQVLVNLAEFGYFLSRGGTILLRQNGVFRTNCVDCLDRTNVVQSLLARLQLTAALRLLAVWADHADVISTQYSGTGALKTDFTRTGKRTRLGLVRDGVNSLTRYYKNNFSDGFRQDSIDLFLGKHGKEFVDWPRLDAGGLAAARALPPPQSL
ncbi:hypothetical protein HF086_011901, partial [Spodoptera exigua]